MGIICMLIANAHRDPKKRRRPYEVSDFDHYTKKDKRQQPPMTKADLRAMFERFPKKPRKRKDGIS